MNDWKKNLTTPRDHWTRRQPDTRSFFTKDAQKDYKNELDAVYGVGDEKESRGMPRPEPNEQTNG